MRLRARLTLTIVVSLLVAFVVLAAVLLNRFQGIFEETGTANLTVITEALAQ